MEQKEQQQRVSRRKRQDLIDQYVEMQFGTVEPISGFYVEICDEDASAHSSLARRES